MRLVRRKSFTGSWHLSVSPPHFVIYVCINLRTGAVYIGQTTQTPVQRLRKHYADAHARTDSATFHSLILLTEFADWVPIPVQHTETLFQTGLAERAWWSELKNLAVNDVPPGICESDTSNKVRSYLSHRILLALREFVWRKN